MALYGFDGTGDKWNKDLTVSAESKTYNGRYHSNVVKFIQKYVEVNSEQQFEYIPGVATNGGKIGYMTGGLLGTGASRRVRKAFKLLVKRFKAGDEEIVIVGYSRGAAIARMFAERIETKYKKIKDKDGTTLVKPPIIKFIGLFDTVASFGLPFNDFEWRFKKSMPSNVETAVHAMALDEPDVGFGLDRAYGFNTLEVWFAGGHGDIGGTAAKESGQPNIGRTNIALNFMVKKAAASGVKISIDGIDIDTGAEIQKPKIDGVISDNTTESRTVHRGDVIHYSVYEYGYPDNERLKKRWLSAKDLAVQETIANENELSKTIQIYLTPQQQEKYSTSDIYDLLNRNLLS